MARTLDEQGQALLDAASELLASEGAGGLTVRRIAADAGCSTMGVYSRFGNKDGVVDHLYMEGFRRLIDPQGGSERQSGLAAVEASRHRRTALSWSAVISRSAPQ